MLWWIGNILLLVAALVAVALLSRLLGAVEGKDGGLPGIETVDRKGMVYDPLRDHWRISDRDLSVNYAAVAVRPVD